MGFIKKKLPAGDVVLGEAKVTRLKLLNEIIYIAVSIALLAVALVLKYGDAGDLKKIFYFYLITVSALTLIALATFSAESARIRKARKHARCHTHDQDPKSAKQKIIKQNGRGKLSLWNEIIYLLACAVLIALLIIYREDADKLSFAAIMMSVAMLAVSVILFIIELIRIKSTELVLTQTKVIGKLGFIKISLQDSQLSNIDNIQINFSFFGRLFNYGDLMIESRSDSFRYRNIAKPLAFRQLINEQISKYLNK
jgi:membrane protein YdbS with pleckstrin-like domain